MPIQLQTSVSCKQTKGSVECNLLCAQQKVNGMPLFHSLMLPYIAVSKSVNKSVHLYTEVVT